MDQNDKVVTPELRERWREEGLELWANPPEGYQFPAAYGNPRDNFLRHFIARREQEFLAISEPPEEVLSPDERAAFMAEGRGKGPSGEQLI